MQLLNNYDSEAISEQRCFRIVISINLFLAYNNSSKSILFR